MHNESSMLYQCLVDAMVVKVDFLCQVDRVNSFCHCEAQLFLTQAKDAGMLSASPPTYLTKCLTSIHKPN